MKKIIYILSIVFIGILMACEDDAEKVVISSDPVKPVVLSPEDESLIFTREDSAKFAFKWSKAELGYNAVVEYGIQVSLDEDFAKKELILSTTEVTEGEVLETALNNTLHKLGAEDDVPVSVYTRVFASISEYADSVFSASKVYTVTPYATVFPPIYMIGGALKGWDLNLAVEVPATNNGKAYHVIAEFKNGETFRFFTQPDWGADQYKWAYFDGGTVAGNFEAAMDDDDNFRFIGTSGYYIIKVNLNDKTISMEEADEPTLYGIGEALQGWVLESAVQLTWVKDSLFQVTTTMNADKAFRFFDKADWSTGKYNYLYFEDGEVDPLLENAADGDSNLLFVGSTGSYEMTVDLKARTVGIK
ncbi:SusE domain-containing protein [Fulvivirga sediminis]|uniref:SusE domain-containing protein n=1 Tax=Fulvivirga sediminis TaxID=2803949 RepID=A0A937F3K8_9BACT|nr:SusE domain-containing protein [Fulvivirga sediminis]MBL3655712.1 SusE domain-containing protein [Fulvivirga sediminis]